MMTDEEKRERYEQLRKQQENDWPRMTDEEKRELDKQYRWSCLALFASFIALIVSIVKDW